MNQRKTEFPLNIYAIFILMSFYDYAYINYKIKPVLNS